MEMRSANDLILLLIPRPWHSLQESRIPYEQQVVDTMLAATAGMRKVATTASFGLHLHWGASLNINSERQCQAWIDSCVRLFLPYT